jgi:hypothetical protein
VFGGGLSNVMPSTDGDTDGLVVLTPPTPFGGLVVPPPPPPPAGDVVVPPLGDGLVGLPLAVQVLLLGDVVGNCVVRGGVVATPPPVNGTMTMPPEGVAVALDDELPAAVALATNAEGTPTVSPALNANRTIRSPLRGVA